MNVLIYTILIITVMLIAVTARMPSSLMGHLTRVAYTEQMAKTELKIIDKAARAKYKMHTQKVGTEGDASVNNHQNLIGTLSFGKAVKNPEGPEKIILVNLINYLLERAHQTDNSWYDEYKLDLLLTELNSQWKSINKSKLENLSNIPIENSDLNVFRTKLLKLLINKSGTGPYIRIDKGNAPLSIYRANKDLLMVLFNQDESLVNEIIDYRLALHKSLPKKNGLDSLEWKKILDEKSGDFEQRYSNYSIVSNGITFRISSTKPQLP